MSEQEKQDVIEARIERMFADGWKGITPGNIIRWLRQTGITATWQEVTNALRAVERKRVNQ